MKAAVDTHTHTPCRSLTPVCFSNRPWQRRRFYCSTKEIPSHPRRPRLVTSCELTAASPSKHTTCHTGGLDLTWTSASNHTTKRSSCAAARERARFCQLQSPSVRVENASAQKSLCEVGGFPLGAVNPVARQTLYGSFRLPDCAAAQTGPPPPPHIHPLCWKIKNKKKNPGMKYRDKSHFYEGPCQNGRDLGRTPSFPSLHLDHTTPFRCGDCREIQGEMGGGGVRRREWRVFSLSQT